MKAWFSGVPTGAHTNVASLIFRSSASRSGVARMVPTIISISTAAGHRPLGALFLPLSDFLLLTIFSQKVQLAQGRLPRRSLVEGPRIFFDPPALLGRVLRMLEQVQSNRCAGDFIPRARHMSDSPSRRRPGRSACGPSDDQGSREGRGSAPRGGEDVAHPPEMSAYVHTMHFYRYFPIGYRMQLRLHTVCIRSAYALRMHAHCIRQPLDFSQQRSTVCTFASIPEGYPAPPPPLSTSTVGRRSTISISCSVTR